ncbi:MAG: PspC domain-containing protein [Bacteroidetes bacterium]|nr:PspC domain-containing protein [Bacteroidota bacterium]
MTKVFNINLGGLPFTIDEDAYETLSSYLKTIHHHFRSSEGYEEITTDIEARMAELFQEKLGSRQIVSLKDVNSVISIMGTPEDFGAEPIDEPLADEPQTKYGKKFKIKTGKRLFSNPDEKVIGGVCSGIAAYFGIADPLWVRLIFILFTFVGGFAFALYLILWAILPKAITASDKLAMRGEPINASNIGKIIEEEFEHVSKKVSELGDEIKAEFGSKKKSTGSQPDGSSSADASTGGHQFRAAASEGIHVLSTIIGTLGGIIRRVLETIVKIIRPIGFIIGIALVAMLVLFWVSAVGGLFVGLPFATYLIPGSTFLTTLGAVNILIFLGVPLLMLALGVMRFFMRTNFKPRWTAGLWLFWALNLVSLMFVSVRTVREFSHGGDVGLGSNTTEIAPTDTLFIDFEDNPYRESFMSFGGDLYISDNKLICEKIRLKVEPSESNKFEIYQSNYSRGEGVGESQQLASKIDYQYRIEGNHLVLPRFFELNKGEKWRGQRVHIIVKVPQDKWVRPGKNFDWRNLDLQVDDKFSFPWWDSQYPWKMGKEGLFNPEFAKQHEEEKHDLSNYRDFTKIRLEGEVGLDIHQSGEYSVKFNKGERNNWDDVQIRQQGDMLVISGNPDGRVMLEITAPNLTELWLNNSDDVTLHDFDLASFRLVNEGEAKVVFKANVNNLDVNLSGDNRLQLVGNCNNLKASLENDARLDAGEFSVRVADITANNDSWVKISAVDTLFQHFDESSDLVSKLKTSVVIEK